MSPSLLCLLFVVPVHAHGEPTPLAGQSGAPAVEAEAGDPAGVPTPPPDEPPVPTEPPPTTEGPAPTAPPENTFQAPVLLSQVNPAYLPEARAQGLQGQVVIHLTVKEDGSVGDVTLVSGPDPLLNLPALESARQLRFRPATQSGVPVAAELDYAFSFQLGITDEQGTAVPGSLAGVVVDGDGLEVPGATVQLRCVDCGRAPLTLTTRADGSFQASFLPSGKYIVSVEHPTFQRSETEMGVAAGENVSRQFTVFPMGSYEIQVSWADQVWREVERAPLQANEGTVTSSYTLTRRDVESTPGALEDVSRAVHALPGIVSDGDMLATFHARGGEAGDIVFLLDRIPLENPFHLAGFNSLFNPDMIAGVEFYAGAAPAHVTAATSAVLAVESWDGTPRQDSSDLDGAFDLSASSVRALVMGPIGKKSTFALAARRSYLESYFQVMKWMNLLDTAFAAPEYSEVSGRYAWNPTPEHRVMATVMHTGDSLALVESGDDALISIDGTFQLDNSLTLVSVDHRFRPHDDLTWQTTTGFTRSHDFMLRDLAGESFQDTFSRRAYGRSDVVWTPGKHEVQVGLDGSWFDVDTAGSVDDYRTEPTWYNAPMGDYATTSLDLQGANLAYAETSGWLEETWNGPVRVRAGGRATLTGVTDELLLSPRAGLSIPLPTGTIPKASWGIYQKIPRSPVLLSPVLGNPDLEAEQAVHYVVGLDQGIPLPVEEGGMLVRVEGYLIELSNLIVNPDNAEAVAEGTTYTNDGSGRNTGVDTMIGVRAGRVQGMATWSYLVATRHNPLNEIYAQDYAPAQDQRHTVAGSVEVQVTPRWRATARYSFHTGRPMSLVEEAGDGETFAISCLNCERMGNFNQLDLRAEWRKALRTYRLSFYIEVLNVTNAKSEFVPIVAMDGDARVDSMFYHLPTRPFLGIRADF